MFKLLNFSVAQQLFNIIEIFVLKIYCTIKFEKKIVKPLELCKEFKMSIYLIRVVTIY